MLVSVSELIADWLFPSSAQFISNVNKTKKGALDGIGKGGAMAAGGGGGSYDDYAGGGSGRRVDYQRGRA